MSDNQDAHAGNQSPPKTAEERRGWAVEMLMRHWNTQDADWIIKEATKIVKYVETGA